LDELFVFEAKRALGDGRFGLWFFDFFGATHERLVYGNEKQAALPWMMSVNVQGDNGASNLKCPLAARGILRGHSWEV
jgi:hypothetical protein